MSRYIQNIITPRPANEAAVAVEEYLVRKRFKPYQRGGEGCWKKGSGLFRAPQIVKIGQNNGQLHLEAWIKVFWLPGSIGELGTSGILAWLPKRKLKKRVKMIERLAKELPQG